VIRQAISCDICGAEKKQTNHWFVAWETAGELRVSGWNSRNRLRAGSMHLCGQACLHKLADDFMARVIAGKTSAKTQAAIANDSPEEAQSLADTSLTSPAAHQEIEPSARLLPSSPLAPLPTVAPRPQPRTAGPLVLPERPRTESLQPLSQPLPDNPPRFASSNWRAEAWERELERTQHTGGAHRPALISRRISQA
jgi:hypothetical protein